MFSFHLSLGQLYSLGLIYRLKMAGVRVEELNEKREKDTG